MIHATTPGEPGVYASGGSPGTPCPASRIRAAAGSHHPVGAAAAGNCRAGAG